MFMAAAQDVVGRDNTAFLSKLAQHKAERAKGMRLMDEVHCIAFK